MSNPTRIVIDTNIFISALIKNDGLIRGLLINSGYDILFPDYIFQEIYQHKQEILNKSGYSLQEFTEAITALLNHVRIIDFHEICNNFNEANSIIGHIDPDDAIFIATALSFDAYIWSDDKHFKKQDRIKTFTTKEMIDFIKKT